MPLLQGWAEGVLHGPGWSEAEACQITARASSGEAGQSLQGMGKWGKR